MSTKTLSTIIQMLDYSSEFSYPLVKDWEIRATYTCVVLQGAGDTVLPLTSGLGNQGLGVMSPQPPGHPSLTSFDCIS